MGQFLPADHSLGDANTIGGYMAVHARPAAFEGKDGASYSVEILADQTGESERPFAAYLLFVKWREGDPVAAGHLETDYLAYGTTEAAALAELGAMKLSEVRSLLDLLIAERAAIESDRTPDDVRWWDAMRGEGDV
ncbi:MAG TPA: hypothetical protein VES88_11820 [Gemmatimonadaceae bacterium]|nr:hypothetical protein [Gemmatimonadaceae bacterium]